MPMYPQQRKFKRTPAQFPLNFRVLSEDEISSKKIKSFGTVIDVSQAGIGLVTNFPLQPGHMLEWDDENRKGNLHIAMLRWAQQQNEHYRAGLMFI